MADAIVSHNSVSVTVESSQVGAPDDGLSGIVNGLRLSIPFWLIFALALWLAGCGGSSPAATNNVESTQPPGGCAAEPGSGGCTATGQQTCPPNNTGTWPNCTPIPPAQLICAVGGDPDNNGCTCPQGTTAQGTPPLCEPPAPPPPVCAVGGDPDNNGCTCPVGTSAVGSPPLCLVPACPSNTYGTEPNCLPIPSCSLIVGGYWGGPATGCVCPASDTGTYPTCAASAPPPSCSNGDIDPPACVTPPPVVGCPAGEVKSGPACLPALAPGVVPTVTIVSLTAGPSSLQDYGTGSPATCTQVDCASISVVTSDPVGNQYVTCTGPASVGPFPPAQDGTSVSVTVICLDAYGIAYGISPVSATVLIPIIPPPPAPADILACIASTDSGGNPDSLCTYTSAVQGDACYIWDLSATSGAYALTGSGQGQSQGTVQGPQLFGPTVFALECTLSAGAQVTVTP
jgi:hypothetical protein